jgi:SAM-dependent methyltransferase
MRGVVDRMLEHPAVYALWQAPFAKRKFAPIERHIAGHAIRRILDVGCGPGTNAARFDAADYVGVDINGDYLAIARSKYRGRFVQADLARADLAPLGTFDVILVNSFLHHLDDDAVHRVLTGLARLLDPAGKVHILELVLPAEASITRIMAKLDRGRYARPLAAWRDLFEAHFEGQALEPYTLGRLWAMVYFQGKARL